MNTFYYILLKNTRFNDFQVFKEVIEKNREKSHYDLFDSIMMFLDKRHKNDDIMEHLIYYEVFEEMKKQCHHQEKYTFDKRSFKSSPPKNIEQQQKQTPEQISANKIQKKFNIINKIDETKFLSYEKKEKYRNIFQKSQSVYHILNRLVARYRMKKIPIFMATDLYMNPIEETQKNVITIIQNNKKYLFTVQNMIHIIETALCNSPYFFSTPLSIKNPYTNIPFEKSILYAIYFQLRETMMNIHPIFHAYFITNFNLLQFREENEALIHKHYLAQYVKNIDDDTGYNLVMEMMSSYDYLRYITIHRDFPRKILIEIMRPYITIYIETVYVSNSYSYYKSQILRKHLNKFLLFNVDFGRKNVKMVDGKLVTTFNDNHPKFSLCNKNDYSKSHCEIEDEIFKTSETIYRSVPVISRGRERREYSVTSEEEYNTIHSDGSGSDSSSSSGDDDGSLSENSVRTRDEVEEIPTPNQNQNQIQTPQYRVRRPPLNERRPNRRPRLVVPLHRRGSVTREMGDGVVPLPPPPPQPLMNSDPIIDNYVMLIVDIEESDKNEEIISFEWTEDRISNGGDNGY
jgi:hypothetical protein